jgi:hypothetical protein
MTDGTLVEASSAAGAASIWWAAQIKNPTFRHTDPGSSDNPAVAILSMDLAYMVSEQTMADDQSTAKFVKILREKVQGELDACVDDLTYINLDVDYGPGRLLKEAADEAGIPYSRFPWKTMMFVYPDHVIAALGYGAPSSLVWATDEWLNNRQPCGANRCNKDFDPLDEVCPKPVFHEGECGD